MVPADWPGLLSPNRKFLRARSLVSVNLCFIWKNHQKHKPCKDPGSLSPNRTQSTQITITKLFSNPVLNQLVWAFSAHLHSCAKSNISSAQSWHNERNLSLALTYWSLFLHFRSLVVHKEHLGNTFFQHTYFLTIAPITSTFLGCCCHNLIEHTAFWQKALIKLLCQGKSKEKALACLSQTKQSRSKRYPLKCLVHRTSVYCSALWLAVIQNT